MNNESAGDSDAPDLDQAVDFGQEMINVAHGRNMTRATCATAAGTMFVALAKRAGMTKELAQEIIGIWWKNVRVTGPGEAS